MRGWAGVVGRRLGGGCAAAAAHHLPLPTLSALSSAAGIIANILVCYAVWLANASRDAAGKIIGIYM